MSVKYKLILAASLSIGALSSAETRQFRTIVPPRPSAKFGAFSSSLIADGRPATCILIPLYFDLPRGINLGCYWRSIVPRREART